MTLPLPIAPSFIERDPAVVRAAILAQLETALGRALHPAQVETLLAEVVAYQETLVRIAIQDVALQNLVAFARAPALDYLGELVGVGRLPERPAVTTVRFTLAAAQPLVVVVPAGTRVQTTDGKIAFATNEAINIAAGNLTGDVVATATSDGAAGNGYDAGVVSRILDPVPNVASAANLATTEGGADLETDDSYRQRIREGTEQFSTAGSAAAYRFHAMSVSSSIIDVKVTGIPMGVVRVCVLSEDGPASPALLAEVLAALSAEKVRPLTDTVQVVAPDEVPYAIDAVVRPIAGTDAAAVLLAAQEAADAYAADRRAGLGRDVVPSQVIAALSVPGTYAVTLIEPLLIEVGDEEWANCADITVVLGPAGG